MQVKCEYCGAYIDDSEEFCKHCGAVNSNFKRAIDGTPKTIEELKIWYKQKNLPPKEVTRFFIGENFSGPRAFGIYEENGEYIVYKNKDDGTRAERYRGRDEAYAVNELYLKLKSEILNQKAHNINKKNGNTGNNGSGPISFKKRMSTFAVMFLCVIGLSVVSSVPTLIRDRKDRPYAGNYYSYDNNVYYCNSYVDDDWYWYDYDTKDYVPVEIPEEMYDDIQNYKYSEYDDWDSSIEKFEDTSTGQYVESIRYENSSDDSSDSGFSWDSDDSWDSGDSDWGSDW